MLSLLSFFLFIFLTPIYDPETIESFRIKTCLNPIKITEDPYNNNYNISNSKGICALKYVDNNRNSYHISTFIDETTAESKGYYVTHDTPCGACSPTTDLAVYMDTPDLTNPARQCGVVGIINSTLGIQCLKNIGFTDNCALIWWYNTVNSRIKCAKPCLIHWNSPPNQDDGSLNPCLQCDEDESGVIFKIHAGRTRRNSGLLSNIERPINELYPIIHNYN